MPFKNTCIHMLNLRHQKFARMSMIFLHNGQNLEMDVPVAGPYTFMDLCMKCPQGSRKTSSYTNYKSKAITSPPLKKINIAPVFGGT